MNEQLLEHVLEQATRFGLVEELITTPKPGLVDLHDCGAHTDMDVELFLKSIEAIGPYIVEMGMSAYRYDQDLMPGIKDLATHLEKLGRAAEHAMFEVTSGVNTHKGAIYTLGCLAASVGLVVKSTGRDWEQRVQEPPDQDSFFAMVLGKAALLAQAKDADYYRRLIPHETDDEHRQSVLSHGDRVYLLYGIEGLRAQAVRGFPALVSAALPAYHECVRRFGSTSARSTHFNAAKLTILLRLMATIDDTNLISRAGPQEGARVQCQARALIARDVAFAEDSRELLAQLNEDFCARKLSPGGAADLLEATLFLLKANWLLFDEAL